MKKINPELIRKLKSYSALAVPFVAGAGIANGQVIHTDIDPDSTLTRNNQIVFLDLNHDGINDFAVGIADTILASRSELVRAVSGTAFKYNSIAGSAAAAASGSYLYPYALKAGDVIGSQQLKWNKGSNQSMGSFFQSTKSTSKFASYGNWRNQQDKYMGLRFFLGQSYYYGWVRMDTRVDKDTVFVTLKDYAYQAIGDSSIAAGDTGSAVTGIHPVNNNQAIKINYFNHEVYITSPQNSMGEMAIEIFDMEGRRLLEYNTSQKQYQFSTATLPEGLFLVRVVQNGKTYTKKISLR